MANLLGILGGTFDPVHLGHLQLAREALAGLKLDSLYCIPAGEPPHRQAPYASPTDRLAMVTLAFAQEPQCLIDATEIRQSGPSWTIRTLERLRAAHPGDSLILIVGADAFQGLPTWHRWQELLHFAHIAIANRPGTVLDAVAMPPALAELWRQHHTNDLTMLKKQPAGCLVTLPITPCPVSATEIRQRLQRGESITELVPGAVARYIQQHQLYTRSTH